MAPPRHLSRKDALRADGWDFSMIRKITRSIRTLIEPRVPRSAGKLDNICSGDCFKVEAKSEQDCTDQTRLIRQDLPEMLPLPQQELAAAVYTTALKPWQIRLLRIHRGSSEEGLIIDLVITDMFGSDGVALAETIVYYDALSYAWGTSDSMENILCNGSPYSVTQNLGSALKELRRSKAGSLLWIHVLCINQFDDAEKSHQVHGMLDIYQRASAVLVWLGRRDSASDLAMGCLARAQTYRTKISSKKQHSTSCLTDLRAMYSALRDLYSRPWFRRSWVRQEIYGARHVTLLCGSERIEWADLMTGGDLLRSVAALVATHHVLAADEKQSLQALLTTLGDFSKSGSEEAIKKAPRDFTDVLMASPFFEAGDDRDYIYAVLGMTGIPTDSARRTRVDLKSKIRIDYGKTTSEVYQDAVRFILEQGKTSQQLAKIFNYHTGRLDRVPALPTWTMDWKASRCTDSDVATIRRHERRRDEIKELQRQEAQTGYTSINGESSPFPPCM